MGRRRRRKARGRAPAPVKTDHMVSEQALQETVAPELKAHLQAGDEPADHGSVSKTGQVREIPPGADQADSSPDVSVLSPREENISSVCIPRSHLMPSNFLFRILEIENDMETEKEASDVFGNETRTDSGHLMFLGKMSHTSSKVESSGIVTKFRNQKRSALERKIVKDIRGIVTNEGQNLILQIITTRMERVSHRPIHAIPQLGEEQCSQKVLHMEASPCSSKVLFSPLLSNLFPCREFTYFDALGQARKKTPLWLDPVSNSIKNPMCQDSCERKDREVALHPSHQVQRYLTHCNSVLELDEPLSHSITSVLPAKSEVRAQKVRMNKKPVKALTLENLVIKPQFRCVDMAVQNMAVEEFSLEGHGTGREIQKCFSSSQASSKSAQTSGVHSSMIVRAVTTSVANERDRTFAYNPINTPCSSRITLITLSRSPQIFTLKIENLDGKPTAQFPNNSRYITFKVNKGWNCTPHSTSESRLLYLKSLPDEENSLLETKKHPSPSSLVYNDSLMMKSFIGSQMTVITSTTKVLYIDHQDLRQAGLRSIEGVSAKEDACAKGVQYAESPQTVCVQDEDFSRTRMSCEVVDSKQTCRNPTETGMRVADKESSFEMVVRPKLFLKDLGESAKGQSRSGKRIPNHFQNICVPLLQQQLKSNNSRENSSSSCSPTHELVRFSGQSCAVAPSVASSECLAVCSETVKEIISTLLLEIVPNLCRGGSPWYVSEHTFLIHSLFNNVVKRLSAVPGVTVCEKREESNVFCQSGTISEIVHSVLRQLEKDYDSMYIIQFAVAAKNQVVLNSAALLVVKEILKLKQKKSVNAHQKSSTNMRAKHPTDPPSISLPLGLVEEVVSCLLLKIDPEFSNSLDPSSKPDGLPRFQFSQMALHMIYQTLAALMNAPGVSVVQEEGHNTTFPPPDKIKNAVSCIYRELVQRMGSKFDLQLAVASQSPAVIKMMIAHVTREVLKMLVSGSECSSPCILSSGPAGTFDLDPKESEMSCDRGTEELPSEKSCCTVVKEAVEIHESCLQPTSRSELSKSDTFSSTNLKSHSGQKASCQVGSAAVDVALDSVAFHSAAPGSVPALEENSSGYAMAAEPLSLLESARDEKRKPGKMKEEAKKASQKSLSLDKGTQYSEAEGHQADSPSPAVETKKSKKKRKNICKLFSQAMRKLVCMKPVLDD
ncbi:uncharacterized protein [Lepisosteus oculatus]|uniref:uncharacterized protein n=1 Tax=Lepisosteus oculatus TaxID=7918 RepID=UPI0035F51254